MTQKQKPSFADNCHKYGWVITIILNLVFFAYFTGSNTAQLEDVKNRVIRLEKQIDSLTRITRGEAQ